MLRSRSPCESYCRSTKPRPGTVYAAPHLQKTAALSQQRPQLQLASPHDAKENRRETLLNLRFQLEDDVRAALDAVDDVPDGQGLADGCAVGAFCGQAVDIQAHALREGRLEGGDGLAEPLVREVHLVRRDVRAALVVQEDRSCR